MRICIVGLDEADHQELREHLPHPIIAYEVLPRIIVKDGALFVAAKNHLGMLHVSHVVFHGIFEDDFDFITALAFWGGPCLPNPRAMLACRLKFPCLVQALQHTRFPIPQRGYAAPGAEFTVDTESVAKWGNWHCGENKVRVRDVWMSEHASIIEPYLEGDAVRIVIIGEQAWQIHLEGADWRKSIHDPQATFMALDPELLADTQRLQQAFELEVLANDYIVTTDGAKYLQR